MKSALLATVALGASLAFIPTPAVGQGHACEVLRTQPNRLAEYRRRCQPERDRPPVVIRQPNRPGPGPRRVEQPGRQVVSPPIVPQFAEARAALDAVAPHDWSTVNDYQLLPRLLGNVPFSEFLALAEAGDARAEWLVGAAYYRGLSGVPENHALAVHWLRRAAAQRNARGQNSLGLAYLEGNGVETNSVEALVWTRRAAQQGNAIATFNVGNHYRDGAGVTQGFAEAMDWFRRAVAQGYVTAQVAIGELYAGGLGVTRDYTQARVWYERAAAQGNPWGQTRLGDLYYSGTGVTQNYGQAKAWYERAAAQGHGPAQFTLGFLHERGDGVDQDNAQAATWYRRAVAQGDRSAEFYLGRMLYTGAAGVPQNQQEGLALVNRSAAGGFAEARNWLTQQNLPLPAASR